MVTGPMVLADTSPVTTSTVQVTSTFNTRDLLEVAGFPLTHPVAPVGLHVLNVITLGKFLTVAINVALVLCTLRGNGINVITLLSSAAPVVVLPLL